MGAPRLKTCVPGQSAKLCQHGHYQLRYSVFV